MKEKIINKASELFLTLGFKSVTMDDIANELGISKKTIYVHFPNKTDLVESTTMHMFNLISHGIGCICELKKNPIEVSLITFNASSLDSILANMLDFFFFSSIIITSFLFADNDNLFSCPEYGHHSSNRSDDQGDNKGHPDYLAFLANSIDAGSGIL